MFEKMKNIESKIRAGKLVTGTHLSTGDVVATEIAGWAGFDVLWIDTEHTAIDRGTLLRNIITASATNAAVWVRLPWTDAVMAKPVLEMGPDGIVFPHVRSVEEARLAVAACTYPPLGVRSYGPLRAIRYGDGSVDPMDYIRNQSRKMWKVIQIEHAEAVDCLDEILAIDGVDAIVVGSNDLSGSVGLLGQLEHPTVLKLKDAIAEKALKRGKPFGISMGGCDPKRIRAWRDRGASFIITGSDVFYLTSGAQTTYETLKRLADAK